MSSDTPHDYLSSILIGNLHDKQGNYESKIATKILTALGIGPKEVKDHLGSDPTLPWVIQNYLHSSVGIGTKRLTHRLDMGEILGYSAKFVRTEVYKAFSEIAQNWPDTRYKVLVFDYHGDGIPDLALHDNVKWVSANGNLVTLQLDTDMNLYIQPFKSFLTEFIKDFKV